MQAGPQAVSADGIFLMGEEHDQKTAVKFNWKSKYGGIATEFSEKDQGKLLDLPKTNLYCRLSDENRAVQ